MRKSDTSWGRSGEVRDRSVGGKAASNAELRFSLPAPAPDIAGVVEKEEPPTGLEGVMGIGMLERENSDRSV